MWGGTPIRTGYAARIPVHSRQNRTREYRDICFLTGLAHLARRNRLQLFTSAELMCEQDRHPPARFGCVSYSGMSLFDGIPIDSIDDWNFDALIHGQRGPEELGRIQRERLHASSESLFQQITAILGPRQSQDAWHIWTAERHDLLAFLTMDYSLLATIESQRVKFDRLGLKTWVTSPEQLAKKLRISAVAPHLFSYSNASFPVRTDVHWPGKRRQVRAKRALIERSSIKRAERDKRSQKGGFL
jgi:hypothetical protein